MTKAQLCLPMTAVAGLLSACRTTEPVVESGVTLVTGTVTVGGLPAASGLVELFPEDVATPLVVDFADPIVLASDDVDAGAYRISADIRNPALCASLSVAVRVQDDLGHALAGSKRLGSCGEHMDVDFAF